MQELVPSDGYVENPGQVRELARAIRQGALTSTALVRRCLDRIEAVQPHVEPWREVDGERAPRIAADRDRGVGEGHIRGPLHGIPIGVKDIIDVEGLPTRCNARWRADAKPAKNDAEVVLSLKTAGAIMLGKVHTTEFAFFDPSPARNPHNREHTPGGSSSGSGAAVASGTVPVALGTQTMASVNRPAAYCGVSAFKPSTRLLSIYGVAPLAASYDTIGFYGWSVDDAVTAFEAARPPHTRSAAEPRVPGQARIVMLEDPLISDCGADMSASYQAMAEDFLSRGHTVEARPSPVPFERIGALHWTTMLYEIGRAHPDQLDLPEGQVGTRLIEAIIDGLAIETDRYLDERGELDKIRTAFFAA
ncbi:MAG: amidase, partial [Geminicoccaceae bacterium]